MNTRAVNLRKEAYDVYIGRGGHGQDGLFGNPFARGKKCSSCGDVHSNGGSTLICFEAYFIERMYHDREYARAVYKLRGKKLGCFCKPAPCHGDVMAKYINDKNFWEGIAAHWNGAQ